MKKPFIIAIEGTDGSGKSTQAYRLAKSEVLQGSKVVVQHFPSKNPSGDVIYQILNGDRSGNGVSIEDFDAWQMGFMYMADFSFTYHSQHLGENDYIIFDRYYMSNLYHQIPRIPNPCDMTEKVELSWEQKEYIDWVEDMATRVLKLPEPDLVIYFNASADLVRERMIESARIVDSYEADNEYQRQVCRYGLAIAAEKGWNIINCQRESIPGVYETISEEAITAAIEELIVKAGMKED